MRFTFTTSLLNHGLLSLALITNIFAVSSVHADLLMTKVKAIENQLDARIGVSIYDATHNQHWHYNGDTRFPLMSTFKTFACAKLLVDVERGLQSKLLVDVERGLQSFDTSSVITTNAIITWSPITEKLVGESISLKQACAAAMTM
ncbi:MAG: serine hydrolase, partial [Gammaproteobacteria bacterium]|nr:serine hydrolase [Gammaproteobacteria bacterium]